MGGGRRVGDEVCVCMNVLYELTLAKEGGSGVQLVCVCTNTHTQTHTVCECYSSYSEDRALGVGMVCVCVGGEWGVNIRPNN